MDGHWGTELEYSIFSAKIHVGLTAVMLLSSFIRSRGNFAVFGYIVIIVYPIFRQNHAFFELNNSNFCRAYATLVFVDPWDDSNPMSPAGPGPLLGASLMWDVTATNMWPSKTERTEEFWKLEVPYISLKIFKVKAMP